MIISDARCTREIKSRIFTVKAALNKKKALLTTKLVLNLRNKPLKYEGWNFNSGNYLFTTDTK